MFKPLRIEKEQTPLFYFFTCLNLLIFSSSSLLLISPFRSSRLINASCSITTLISRLGHRHWTETPKRLFRVSRMPLAVSLLSFKVKNPFRCVWLWLAVVAVYRKASFDFTKLEMYAPATVNHFLFKCNLRSFIFKLPLPYCKTSTCKNM